MQDPMTTNKAIVEYLISSLGYPNTKELVNKLCALLHLGETSVYNKINSRTNFSTAEIFTLFNHFNLSLDAVITQYKKHNSFVPFHADGLKYQPRYFADYFNNIISYYTKLKLLQNVHGYFLTNEVPLFHMLPFKNLIYLKLYIWNKSNWAIKGIAQDFNPSHVMQDPELLKSLRLLTDLYYSFSDTEIWDPSMLDNSISQILYLKDIGIIHRHEDLTLLLKDMVSLIHYLESLTTVGAKPDTVRGHSNQCHIYSTDLILGSEVIIVKSETLGFYFQQVDVPNYIRSNDASLIDNQLRYFENIKNMSHLISKASEKERHKFFQHLRAKVTAFSEAIQR